MEPHNTNNSKTVDLEDKFRIEDTAIQILIRKLENQSMAPEYVGNVANEVLNIVSESHSRAEMADLIKKTEEQYPELHAISEQEEVYVKEQAEMIIKQTVEELITAQQTDAALKLAKTINNGEVPVDIQEKIAKI